MDPEADPDSGQAIKPEVIGTHLVRFDGAATTNLPATPSNTPPSLDVLPETFTATASASALWNNFGGESSATIVGTISQDDANKRAAQVSQARANYLLSVEAVPKSVTT